MIQGHIPLHPSQILLFKYPMVITELKMITIPFSLMFRITFQLIWYHIPQSWLYLTRYRGTPWVTYAIRTAVHYQMNDLSICVYRDGCFYIILLKSLATNVMGLAFVIRECCDEKTVFHLQYPSRYVAWRIANPPIIVILILRWE